ncbi:DUF983 domain-containing protein [uncultured Lutibacter sp.]|uniref:DUF983 domain-containing protein n=1 Tax=uncultured Lutibacter sp. TaxID=437739 RepID=UPI0026083A68|nr:DUF983 domain-containing protein [uncultured Lutibacter sp.]
MIKKGTKLYSVLFNKCPRCHKGSFMEGNNIFSFKNINKMKESCSNCNLKYMMEPSFYYGAMYITYALSVGISVATFIISNLIFKLNLLQCFIPIVVVLILTSPITLRFSRIIWINIFVKYNPKLKDSKND